MSENNTEHVIGKGVEEFIVQPSTTSSSLLNIKLTEKRKIPKSQTDETLLTRIMQLILRHS